MATLRAGAAQAVITPPIGVGMTGFAARPSDAVGIHDDLCARALVLDDGQSKVAVLALDLLGLDDDLLLRLRHLVEEWTGVPAECLLVNTSHTHGGPAANLLRGMGRRDHAYCDVMTRQAAGAVKMACDRLREARIGFGQESVQVGLNRRRRRDDRIALADNPEGPTDSRVDIVRVDASDGAPLAVLFRHAAHPVVLGGDNVLITADWCGYATRAVAEWLSPSPVALFLQGCCGDINPRWRGSFDAAQRCGNLLGAAVGKGWQEIETTDEVTLKAASEVIGLPLQDPPSVGEAERQLEAYRQRAAEAPQTQSNAGMIRTSQELVGWAEKILQLAKEGNSPRAHDFTVQAITVNDFALVGLSGETFIELDFDIAARSPFPRTAVCGYTNGCIGYVPTDKAFDEGGYEVVDAIRYYGDLMIRRQSAQMICNKAVEMLRRLKG